MVEDQRCAQITAKGGQSTQKRIHLNSHILTKARSGSFLWANQNIQKKKSFIKYDVSGLKPLYSQATGGLGMKTSWVSAK